MKKLAIFLCFLCIAALQAADDDPLLRKNVILIFDDSSSMSGSKIDRAQAASQSVIMKLSENYNFGIYALNRREIFPLQPVTDSSRRAAVMKTQELRASGTTPLGEAIVHATDMLLRQRDAQSGYGYYIIVIATDGEANDTQKMLDAVNAAIEKGVMIKTIGINIHNHALSWVTQFTEASSVQELSRAMERAVNAEANLGSGFIAQDF